MPSAAEKKPPPSAPDKSLLFRYCTSMSRKKPSNGMGEPEVEYRADVPVPTEAESTEVDRWLERNKKALEKSFAKASADFRRGHYHTHEKVMAAIKEQQRRRAAKE